MNNSQEIQRNKLELEVIEEEKDTPAEALRRRQGIPNQHVIDMNIPDSHSPIPPNKNDLDGNK